MKYRIWSSALLVLALVVAACGGDGAATTTAAGATTTTAAAGETTTTAAAGDTTTTAAAAGETPYAELNQAYAGDFAGTSVEIIAQWAPDGAEAVSFDLALQPFRDKTGIEVSFEPTPEYERRCRFGSTAGIPPIWRRLPNPARCSSTPKPVPW